MAGFREFVTGEVLTAANVDDFLAKQAVMKFADAAARDSALGTAVVSPNALREGMVAWLDDEDTVIAYDGSAWNPVGGGGFDDVEVITATDATWAVPALGNPIVKVTLIGGGGGGGRTIAGGIGGTTTFNAATAGTESASGGLGGSSTGASATDGGAGLRSGNGGQNFHSSSQNTRGDGQGGQVRVVYFDLTGIATVNVTVGSGGAAGAGDAGAGGRGEVIVEYKAA